jgi:tellurite resistance protein TehA-like permease
MDVLIGYLSSVILATALALTVVLLSRNALRRLLVELCGNGARAEYWTMFAGLFVVLCTLYGVLASMPSANSKIGSEYADLANIVGALATFRAGVLGLLIASMCVAFVLLRSVARFEQLASRRAPSWAPQAVPPPIGGTLDLNR